MNNLFRITKDNIDNYFIEYDKNKKNNVHQNQKTKSHKLFYDYEHKNKYSNKYATKKSIFNPNLEIDTKLNTNPPNKELKHIYEQFQQHPIAEQDADQISKRIPTDLEEAQIERNGTYAKVRKLNKTGRG